MSRVAIGAGIALLLTSAVLGHTVLRRWSAEGLARRLRTCLGGEPLAAGEPGFLRLHRVQAAEDRRAGSKRSDWPARCSELVAEAASSRSVKSLAGELAERAEKAEGDVGSGKVTSDVGALLEAAQAFGGARPAGADTPRPAPPLVPLLDAQAEGVHERCVNTPSLAPMGLDVQPARGFAFEVLTKANPRICQVSPQGEPRCAPIPPALAGGRFISGGDPEQPIFAVGEAVRSLRGDELASKPQGYDNASTVFFSASGATATLLPEPEGGAKRALVWRKGKAEARSTTPPGAILAAGHLLWSDGGKLRAKAILDEAPGLGPERELGPAPPRLLLHTRTCRSRGGWTLVTGEHSVPSSLGASMSSDPQTLSLYFVSDKGAWAGPHAVALDVAHSELAETLGAWTLACSEGQAQVGWSRSFLRAKNDVHELSVARCTPETCRLDRASVERLGVSQWSYGSNFSGRPNGLDAPAVVPLGDAAVALLWVDRPFFLARIAPLASLADAPTIALAQQGEHNDSGDAPPGPRLVHYYSTMDQALSHDGSALLLLRSPASNSPFFPFWLSASGARALDCAP